MSEKLSLHQKLIEVRKTAPYLQKKNSGMQYKYVSSSQTIASLRNEMDKQGVLLVPNIVKQEIEHNKAQNRKGEPRTDYLVTLSIEYTWVNADNPEETIVCRWQAYGVSLGIDQMEKAIGKALTYSEKYFLQKFFNIATDKDDPDSFQNNNRQIDPDIEKINYLAGVLNIATPRLTQIKRQYKTPKATLQALENMVVEKKEIAQQPTLPTSSLRFPGEVEINKKGFENVQLDPKALGFLKLSYEQGSIDKQTAITGKWLATYEDKVYLYKSKTGKVCESKPRQILHVWENQNDNSADYAKALLKLFPSKEAKS